MIISQSNDLLAKEVSCVQTLFSKRVDGMIVSISMQTNDTKHFRLFSERNLPLLFFDRFCPTIDCDRIALEFCKQNNLKVPQDVALTSFSDEPFSSVVTPSLSTVKQPGYQMGYQAAQKIMHRIENSNLTIPFEKIVLPTQLIIRESSR